MGRRRPTLMPSGHREGRKWSGPTLSDALLVVASLALVVSLAGPYVRWTRFERRVGRVVLSIDSVRTSALRYRSRNGSWPEGTPTGEIPPELAAELSSGITSPNDGARLIWRRWSVVKPRSDEPAVATGAADTAVSTVPALDSLASIGIRTTDESLLAALLLHYGPAASFVRDSTWTLIISPTSPTSSRADSIG